MKDILTAAEFGKALDELTAKQKLHIDEETKLERPKAMFPGTVADEIEDGLRELLAKMREGKPGDRSEMDRKWAVAITKFEEALAVFLYQVKG